MGRNLTTIWMNASRIERRAVAQLEAQPTATPFPLGWNLIHGVTLGVTSSIRRLPAYGLGTK